MNKRCEFCINRRRFLETSLRTLSTVAVGSTALSLLSACGQQPLSPGGSSGGGGVAIPNSPSNLYTFNFSDYPQLQTTGGSIQVTVNASSGSKSVFITRVSSTVVDTVSTICTHAGCTLNAYDSTTEEYSCPCHGSVFSADGSVITGPAVAPLPSYSSVITGTGIQVTIT